MTTLSIDLRTLHMQNLLSFTASERYSSDTTTPGLKDGEKVPIRKKHPKNEYKYQNM